jgi:hypothetical protein
MRSLETMHDIIVGKMRAVSLDRKPEEIIAAVHIKRASAFENSPLPCEFGPFPLTDSLRDR